MSVAVQSVQDVKNIVKDSNKNDGNGLVHDNGYDPYKVFVSVLFVVLQCKNVSSLLLYHKAFIFVSPHDILCQCQSTLFISTLRKLLGLKDASHKKILQKDFSLFIFKEMLTKHNCLYVQIK